MAEEEGKAAKVSTQQTEISGQTNRLPGSNLLFRFLFCKKKISSLSKSFPDSSNETNENGSISNPKEVGPLQASGSEATVNTVTEKIGQPIDRNESQESDVMRDDSSG